MHEESIIELNSEYMAKEVREDAGVEVGDDKKPFSDVLVCGICPHACHLREDQTGFCRARRNVEGKITAVNYGKVTSIALDPIEKKPFNRFLPGSMILSVGSFGCNLCCPFCQNHSISMVEEQESDTIYVAPRELVNKALELIPKGNVGIAYTYNEPLIGFEYVRDCAKLAHEKGLKNVVVTNGYICNEPLKELLPYIDAFNIDLKGFTERFYKNIKGDLEKVKETIVEASHGGCHVEVTTLVIPGENDGEEEMEALSKWLAGVSLDIPLHITRFYPRYQYRKTSPTPMDTIQKLVKVAEKHLRYVYW